jgi:myosin heavy subunit
MQISAIHSLIQRLSHLNFLDRLFRWSSVQRQLTEANNELQRLSFEAEQKSKEHNLTLEKLHAESTDLKLKMQEIESLKQNVNEAKSKQDQLASSLDEWKQKCLSLESKEADRLEEHSKKVSILNNTIDKINRDRDDEKEALNQVALDKLSQLKETWSRHEHDVESAMRVLTKKHMIEYVEDYPFKGKPDNCIRLGETLYVFDAKSPADDNLNNFNLYLKDQASKSIKYSKNENVSSQVFLVVPTNALEFIKDYCYIQGEVNVYIISKDAVEPILLSLKRVSEYEYVDQLTPDERDEISRVIGRYAHLSKRRIQIDTFFAQQYLQLAVRCQDDLPDEFRDAVSAFEKSEKINPPTDRRRKTLDLGDLQKSLDQISGEAKHRGIELDPDQLGAGLDQLP